jgi:hypothetical protein
MLYFQMVIMAGTVMLAYYFEYTDTFTVNVQGFFCHDSAYRKPYPGPEDRSAVPPVLLYSLAAGVPVLVVSLGLALAIGAEGPGAQPLPLKFLQVAPAWSPEDNPPGRAGWLLKEAPGSPRAPPPHPLRWLQCLVTWRRWKGTGAVGGDEWVSGWLGLSLCGECGGLDPRRGLASSPIAPGR